MHISLVYDEGPGRGLGHRRRMEGLAAALNELGVSTELVPLEVDFSAVDAVAPTIASASTPATSSPWTTWAVA
jgi:spore coat polysaccharide biosynthesis predicted glycosyltransferase SpsG